MSGRVRGILESLLGQRRQAALSDVVGDDELLRRLRTTRDEAAFELLVWRHGAMVLGVCRRAVRDEQLAEDAFQAVFIVLARKGGSIRMGNVGGWLFRVARRVAARAALRDPVLQPIPELPAPTQSCDAESRELAEILDAEVARLPDRLRRPVILCYLGGQSTEDAARELGCPRGTVLSRLATARKRLAERLSRRGVVLPASLPLVDATLCGRLVSATIAGVPAYLSGTIRPGTTAASLAEGVIRSMTRATLITSLGGVLVAATLVCGVGWVAAQGEAPTTVSGESLTLKPQPKQAPSAKAATKPDAKAEDKQAIQLAKLEERREELVKTLDKLDEEVEMMRRPFAAELQDQRARLEAVQAEHNLDRELALEDVRDAAAHLRTAVRQVAVAALDSGSKSPQYEVAQQKQALAEKDLVSRREALKRLTAEKGRVLEQLRTNIARLEAEEARRIRKLESQYAQAREALSRIESQIELTKSQLAGIPLQPGAGIEAKLDALIREVGDLRKDVRESKKPE